MNTNKKEFDDVFSQYTDIKSKFNGSFIMVVYKLSQEELVHKISHQIGLINLMSDRYKKNYLLTRIFNLRDYINARYTNISNTSQNAISNIFLIHDDIISINFNELWCNNIEEFDINHFIFKNDEYFDIKFLEDLLLNTSYVDIISVSQHKFTHNRYTGSKRKYINEKSSNHNDLQKYIEMYLGGLTKSNPNIPKMLIHGSGIIKNFACEDQRIIIVSKSLRDDEIMDYFDMRINIIKAKELEDWLGKLVHPDFEKRLVFGKDIQKGIYERLIKIVYCTEEMFAKIKKNVPSELQSFEIIIIKSYGNDIGKVLKDNYSGIIGITYY